MKVETWGMDLGQMGMAPTRAVNVSPPKLCSVIVLMAVFYPPSLFFFLFEMVANAAHNILDAVLSLNYRGLSTVFVSLYPVLPMF